MSALDRDRSAISRTVTDADKARAITSMLKRQQEQGRRLRITSGQAKAILNGSERGVR